MTRAAFAPLKSFIPALALLAASPVAAETPVALPHDATPAMSANDIAQYSIDAERIHQRARVILAMCDTAKTHPNFAEDCRLGLVTFSQKLYRDYITHYPQGVVTVPMLKILAVAPAPPPTFVSIPVVQPLPAATITTPILDAKPITIPPVVIDIKPVELAPPPPAPIFVAHPVIQALPTPPSAPVLAYQPVDLAADATVTAPVGIAATSAQVDKVETIYPPQGPYKVRPTTVETPKNTPAAPDDKVETIHPPQGPYKVRPTTIATPKNTTAAPSAKPDHAPAMSPAKPAVTAPEHTAPTKIPYAKPDKKKDNHNAFHLPAFLSNIRFSPIPVGLLLLGTATLIALKQRKRNRPADAAPDTVNDHNAPPISAVDAESNSNDNALPISAVEPPEHHDAPAIPLAPAPEADAPQSADQIIVKTLHENGDLPVQRNVFLNIATAGVGVALAAGFVLHDMWGKTKEKLIQTDWKTAAKEIGVSAVASGATRLLLPAGLALAHIALPAAAVALTAGVVAGVARGVYRARKNGTSWRVGVAEGLVAGALGGYAGQWLASTGVLQHGAHLVGGWFHHIFAPAAAHAANPAQQHFAHAAKKITQPLAHHLSAAQIKAAKLQVAAAKDRLVDMIRGHHYSDTVMKQAMTLAQKTLSVAQQADLHGKAAKGVSDILAKLAANGVKPALG